MVCKFLKVSGEKKQLFKVLLSSVLESQLLLVNNGAPTGIASLFKVYLLNVRSQECEAFPQIEELGVRPETELPICGVNELHRLHEPCLVSRSCSRLRSCRIMVMSKVKNIVNVGVRKKTGRGRGRCLKISGSTKVN